MKGIVHGLTPSEQDGSITFTYNRKKYTAVPTVVNGYTQYIVEDKTSPLAPSLATR